jgi:hypothetical protein
MEKSTSNKKYTKDEKAYIASMSEQERMVLSIAQDHLESSFDIERSIGFISWKKERDAKNIT